MRHLNTIDHAIAHFDSALKTVFGSAVPSERPSPGVDLPNAKLSAKECKHVAGLVRVDHAGEVCAQALYQGQALTARDPKTAKAMAQAASEEIDHLAWCEQRLRELESHRSYLNAFWYSGAFTIGAIAGLLGDKYSLGFVAETERQVVKHLQSHLADLPLQDDKTRTILEQMARDEAEHTTMALHAGASELPKPIKLLMQNTSIIMTKLAYYF